MPSGFDSAWCRVSPVRATPNEAVPLPAWAGEQQSAQALIPGRQIGTPAGADLPIPGRDTSTTRGLSASTLTLPVPPRRLLACAQSGKGRCPVTGSSGKNPFSPATGNGVVPRFTRHPPPGGQQGEL